MVALKYKSNKLYLSEEKQIEIACEKDVFERAHLARRQDLTVIVAKILAEDSESRVRIELAACTNHKDIWKILKRDSNPKVRRSTKGNPNFRLKLV